MAFLLEDGTGLANANSYGAVVAYLAYWANVGVTITGAQADQEADLIKSSRYMDLRFRWKGERVKGREQGLQWPRSCVYDEEGEYVPSDAVPVEVQNACFEYARRARAADLAPDPAVDASGVAVVKSVDKVGPIQVEREFSGASASSSTFKPYPTADNLVRHLVLPTAGRVYRA